MAKAKRSKNFKWLWLTRRFILFGYFATLSMTIMLILDSWQSHDNRSNGEICEIQTIRAEVALGKFVGFQTRNCEIRPIVY